MAGGADADGAGGGVGDKRPGNQHGSRCRRRRSSVLPAPAVALGLVLVLCASQAGVAWGWQDWDFYNVNVTDWNPGPRRGHSMHLWNNSVYLFGGRANDKDAEHVPKTYVTVHGGCGGSCCGVWRWLAAHHMRAWRLACHRYEIVTINGTLQFSTYDDKPVQEACANLTSPDCQRFIPLGVMMNDIWEYPLGAARARPACCACHGQCGVTARTLTA